MMNTLNNSLMLITLTMILYFISYKSIIDSEKMSPFECGFDPFESSRISFSSHFFMITIIFLVFDVELLIIMPMIVIMSNVNIIHTVKPRSSEIRLNRNGYNKRMFWTVLF